MSNHRQRMFAALAGALLFTATAAQADKLDPKSVEQFQAQLNLAMQGNADAQFRVGEMYEQGLGTASDGSMAFLWFNKASIQGNARAKEKLAALDSKARTESAEEQDRVNAAMRALQQQQDQDSAKQRAAAEAARSRQAEELAKQRAAAEAAAAKAKADATAKAEAAKAAAPRPAPAPAPAAATPAPAAAAKPAAKKDTEAEFSANPCKGPQAKFLSTCQ